MKKHIILFLALNPIGTDRRALDQEVRAIELELESTSFRECFEFVTRWAVEPLDLLRQLRKLKPTVVHFSAYGRQSATGKQPPEYMVSLNVADIASYSNELASGILFHSSDGHAQTVSIAALKSTIDAAGTSVKLVVLNGCYSDAYAEALLARVDCVVGMGDSIDVNAARSFMIGFYGALGEHESLTAAYKQGCAAINLEGLSGADRPQLKFRDGLDGSKFVLAKLFWEDITTGHPEGIIKVISNTGQEITISNNQPMILPHLCKIRLQIISEIECSIILLNRSESGGIVCLCPSWFAPSERVYIGSNMFPQQHAALSEFHLMHPGKEDILAIFTKEPLSMGWMPQSRMATILSSRECDRLRRIRIQKHSDEWWIARVCFEVR